MAIASVFVTEYTIIYLAIFTTILTVSLDLRTIIQLDSKRKIHGIRKFSN